MLQQSRDSLLQKLFPVAVVSQQTKHNDVKVQTKPVVVTVVSKFKVCPLQTLNSLFLVTPIMRARRLRFSKWKPSSTVDHSRTVTFNIISRSH